jgi:general secretion pathway protein A
MYEAHWGLTRRPFENDCDSGFYFRGESHRAASLKLRYALDNRHGAATLCGPVGTGKTYLAHLVAAKAVEDGALPVHMSYPRVTANEWLAWLAAELGADADADRSLDVVLRSLESRLRQLKTEGRRPVVVVDDAHLADDPDLVQAWHLLLNYQQRADVDFTLLLVGEPRLLTQVGRCRPLAERISVTALLRPLDRGETEQYVTSRLAVAGRTQPVFTADAQAALFEHSGGVPRRVNRLCDLALLVGFAEKLTALTAAEVEGVAAETTLGQAA